MPVPKSKEPSTLIHFFKNEHPEWPHKQVVAAALNTARRNSKGRLSKHLRKKKDAKSSKH